MNEHDARLIEVIDAILRYLDSHPDATDTADGIAGWWLRRGSGDVDLVEAALARMLAQGLVERQDNIDRHVLYSVGKRRKNPMAQNLREPAQPSGGEH